MFFRSSSNRSYELSCSTNLLNKTWKGLGGQFRGKGGPDWLNDTNAATAARFYRLIVK